jgi:phosphoribosylformylglycinamidine cyclo-ligase
MATTTTYKQSGVNIDANEQMVALIRPLMRRTYGPRVLDRHGMFAGLFRLDYDDKLFTRNYRRPVLVGCTDSVGSKVLLAIQAASFRTVGIDMVAMNVNDLITMGAEPLFLLDYLAVHRLDPAQVAEIVAGVSDGCRQADCALLGGETAEIPDLYQRDHFDLAGFAVGVVEHPRIIDGRSIEAGDVAIGLASDGLHSNGFSLVRRLVFGQTKLRLDSAVDGLSLPLGEELLRPTRIYVKPIVSLLRHYHVKRVVRGMAHITGGGLAGNIDRIVPEGLTLTIKKGSWPIPPIFDLIQQLGVDEDEMYRVFNMGVGFVLIVRPTFVDSVLRRLSRSGEQSFVLGELRRGTRGVQLR